jgi:hypothetical protein
MKVWITKYALTAGIEVAEVEAPEAKYPRMVVVRTGHCPQYFHLPDWHTDRKDAVARAEEMRKKKVISLEKQLNKCRAMKFE